MINEITEVCPHCENEITMQWNVSESGYKAYCPVCGKRLMLCTACHDDGYACDYDTDTDSCRFFKGQYCSCEQVDLCVVDVEGMDICKSGINKDGDINCAAS